MNVIWKGAAQGNFGAGRGKKIDRITYHHIVGDAAGAIAKFQQPGIEISANYVISSTGEIYQCVADSDTAYCDGSGDSNSRTISIEHAGGSANVPYTEAMYAASIALTRHLIAKYGITDFQRHRDVVDRTAYPGGTFCPGTLDVGRIVKAAKENSDMSTPEATALVDELFWKFVGRKVKESESAEYVPLLLDGKYNIVLDKISHFAETVQYINAINPAAPTDQTQNLVGEMQVLIDKYKA